MPKKIHTRVKRKKGQRGTHLRKTYLFTNKPAKKGARTFTTQEAAYAWASAKGMKKEDYTLVRMKHNKRFLIQQKSVKVSKLQF